MYNWAEIAFLTPFVMIWLFLLIKPVETLKLSGKKYRNPTARQIRFAQIYATIFVLTFAIIFYFENAFVE